MTVRDLLLDLLTDGAMGRIADALEARLGLPFAERERERASARRKAPAPRAARPGRVRPVREVGGREVALPAAPREGAPVVAEVEGAAAKKPRAVVKRGPAKFRSAATLYQDPARRVRCRACGDELHAAKASQHAWDAHHQAINSRRIETHFEAATRGG